MYLVTFHLYDKPVLMPSSSESAFCHGPWHLSICVGCLWQASDAKGYLERRGRTHAKMSVCGELGWEQVGMTAYVALHHILSIGNGLNRAFHHIFLAYLAKKVIYHWPSERELGRLHLSWNNALWALDNNEWSSNFCICFFCSIGVPLY